VSLPGNESGSCLEGIAECLERALARLEELEELMAQAERSSDRKGLDRLYLDASELATRLGTTRSWVYAHADELGALRLGRGDRPRLRFNADVALSAMNSCSADRGSEIRERPVTKRNPGRPFRKSMGTSTELLPVRGSAEPETHTNRRRTDGTKEANSEPN